MHGRDLYEFYPPYPTRPSRGGGLVVLVVVAALIWFLAPSIGQVRAYASAQMRSLDTWLADVTPPVPPSRAKRPRTSAQPPTSSGRPPTPSRAGRADIPPSYLALYRAPSTQRQCPGLPWTVLAGIGKVESDHGRSSAPGVRSGVNRFGCCAGPMQFNTKNGPPSTWDRYGHGSPYDPADAIPAAARLLCASGAPGNVRQAVHAYNASWKYVGTVLAWASRYGDR